VTSALESTLGLAVSAVSKGSAGSGRSRQASRPSASPTVSRRPRIVRFRSATDAARSSWLSSPSVETSGTGTRCMRRKAADLALDTALRVRLLAGARDAGLIEIVRAQRDKAVGLDPAAALEHLRDRRAQVVIAQQREDSAEELKRLDVRLQERLLGLACVRLHKAAAEKHARTRNRHTFVGTPPITTVASPQSTSASAAGSWQSGTNSSSTTSPSARRRSRT